MNEKLTEVAGLLRKAADLLDEPVLGDGWMPWYGGECPVPGDTKVEIKFRSGNVSSEARSASSWSWIYRDIVAYRVVDDPNLDTEDHTEATGMPPVGWVVEVWDEGDSKPFALAHYFGSGLFEVPNACRRWGHWRYIRPPKSASPKGAKAYVIFDTHVSQWVHRYNYAVGEKLGIYGTVLAVIPVEELE